jgi:hypothetical protein
VQSVDEWGKHRAKVGEAHKAKPFNEEQFAELGKARDAAKVRVATANAAPATNPSRQASAKRPTIDDVAKATNCTVDIVSSIGVLFDSSNDDIAAELFEQGHDVSPEKMAEVKAALKK